MHEKDINFTDEIGKTALYCASRNGWVDIIQLLLINYKRELQTNEMYRKLILIK